jgi:hypothetical protein
LQQKGFSASRRGPAQQEGAFNVAYEQSALVFQRDAAAGFKLFHLLICEIMVLQSGFYNIKALSPEYKLRNQAPTWLPSLVSVPLADARSVTVKPSVLRGEHEADT